MRFRPTAGEERLLALRDRARRWKRAGWIAEAELPALDAATATPWKAFPLLPRAGLFLLAVVGAVAARFFFEMMLPSHFELAIGVALIAAAELLIARMGSFRTGIEEGLWVAGTAILLFDAFRLAASALWVVAWYQAIFGVVLLLVAIRLLHTLLFLVSVAFLMTWTGEFFSSQPIAAWTLLAAGLAALAVHLLPAERPFRASASGWLALGAPAVAWALIRESSLPAAYAIALGCAAVWIAAGIRRRSRFALAGGALAAMAFGYELLEPRAWPVEWKLVAGGVAIFAVAVAIERWLRSPRGGFTSIALDSDAEPRLFEMVAVAAVAPAGAARSEEGLEGEGGRFGGGGASGEY